MAKPDGSVIIDTKLNTDGFGKGAAGLKSQFSGLGPSVKKLGGLIASAFSVKAIVDFGKEAIELGSNLQEVQNVVDVTFTTMNEQVNEFAKNAAKTAGLSETMAKKYMGTFGAMSKSFGFAEQDSYSMSAALTQLTGDVASFYNLSQDTAYTKLKSVFTGETESLKDLGVVMTQTALDDFALRNGLGKTTQQMSEQEKVALRYQFVMQQLAGASGDFIRTQDSWANQTRVLNLQFEQLKATIGQGLINVLTPVLKVINQMIERFQVLADKFLEFTNTVFGNAGGASSSMTETADSAGILAENVEQTEKNAKKAKKALAGFDEINVLSNTNSTGSQIGGIPTDKKSVQSIKSVSKETNALSGSLGKLLELLKPIKEISFTNLIDSLVKLKESLQPYKDLFLDGLNWLWNDILVPLSRWAITDAIPAFLGFLSSALSFLFPILDAIKPTFDWLWNDILVPMGQFVGQVFIDFLNWLTDAFTRLSSWAENNEETINDIFNAFLGFLAGVWIYNSTKNLIQFFKRLGPEIVALGSKFAAAGLQGAFFAASVGILAAGIIALASNWDKMRPAERVITILSSLAAAATAAAIAIALFHTSWSVGLAAAAIAGGVALLGLSFAFKDKTGSADLAQSTANDFYSSYDWNKNFSLPALANGAVLPPNKPFMAMVGDQRHGTNVEAPLSTIQEAVAAVMNEHFGGMMAGFEALLEENQRLRRVVEGIELGDTTIGQAANRYNDKMAIVRGRA